MSLKSVYDNNLKQELEKQLGLKNPMSVPKVEKVVINVGLGEATANSQVIEKVQEQIAQITGQKPIPAKARKSISAFKLRTGQHIGVKVTLRSVKMYQFLEKLFKIVLPRVRDFRGVRNSGFDSFGNYNLGLPEQTLFPEIDFSKIDKVRGLQITIVTNTKNTAEAKLLLELLGMPFEKEKNG